MLGLRLVAEWLKIRFAKLAVLMRFGALTTTSSEFYGLMTCGGDRENGKSTPPRCMSVASLIWHAKRDARTILTGS